MNAQTEIKRGRKYDQVVDGASIVFMRDGFEGASVDEIAREAGVSKATLYSYFPDKKLLFIEVAQREIRRQAETNLEAEHLGEQPRDVLTALGLDFISLLVCDFGLSVCRVVIAEADRFPEIGRAFFENGPLQMETRMVAYFTAAEARGELAIEDKSFAAHQFMELCKAGGFLHRLLGVSEPIPQDKLAYIVDQAVETFLARYGT